MNQQRIRKGERVSITKSQGSILPNSFSIQVITMNLVLCVLKDCCMESFKQNAITDFIETVSINGNSTRPVQFVVNDCKYTKKCEFVNLKIRGLELSSQTKYFFYFFLKKCFYPGPKVPNSQIHKFTNVIG